MTISNHYYCPIGRLPFDSFQSLLIEESSIEPHDSLRLIHTERFCFRLAGPAMARIKLLDKQHDRAPAFLNRSHVIYLWRSSGLLVGGFHQSSTGNRQTRRYLPTTVVRSSSRLFIGIATYRNH